MDGKLDLVLDYLANVSDYSLATSLSNATKVFNSTPHTDEEKIRFIHDVRDAAVFIGGADGFTMTALDIAIGSERSFPPPESDAWLGEWLAKWSKA